ncbi:hypothetical protein [uncultured Olegusella sp.]|nr:hypothetical protein [uncultured Olegusella sp.]
MADVNSACEGAGQQQCGGGCRLAATPDRRPLHKRELRQGNYQDSW